VNLRGVPTDVPSELRLFPKKQRYMVIKYPKTDKEKIFEINPELKALFPSLNEKEMRYVALMADALSPFRYNPEKQELVASIVEKPKKDVSKEVALYNEKLNPPKLRMVTEMLESLYSQFESITRVLSYNEFGGGNQNPEDKIKIQDQCNKIIKDSLDKRVWEQIEFYEEKLSHQYQPPIDVVDKINKKEVKATETADDIDMSAI
jgi:hypothetical protein